MLVAYGIKSNLKPVVSLGHGRCENCNHNVEKLLAVEKKSFTIFYIPVFVKTGDRMILCPCCGESKKLSKREFRQLKKA